LGISGGDSLSYYLTTHDLTSYFNSINSLSETARKKLDKNTLLELGQLVQQDFGELSLSEREKLRHSAARVGWDLWQLTGYVDPTLEIFLVSHENVENKNTLDDFAWYIENQISVFYTMKGDYEKAEYYSALLEASLKYYHMTERLSRHYTNQGTLKYELKDNEATGIYKKGYSLADSIGYALGIVANALGLAGIYNDNGDQDSSRIYLNKASEFLPKITSDKSYLDKKSGLEFEYAQYNLLQKKYAESIGLFKSSIETLSQYYATTNRREFAKIYTALANAYLLAGELDSVAQTIQLGLNSLIPELDPALDFPSYDQLHPENSFIDLFELKTRYYKKLDSLSADNQYLAKALTSIKMALFANDRIRETFLADPSKLVSIQSNKELIGSGISILYQLQSRNTSSEYFDEARSFFNRSKSILYNEKTQRNRIVEIMSEEDKKEWSFLLNLNLELHHQKSEEGADIISINGEILRCQEQIDSIFSKYDDIQLTTSIPDQYVEYFIGEKEIFGMAELNDQKFFTKVGSKIDFNSLVERLNDYLLLKGMSLDETILNEMFIFLIKPFMEQIPKRIVIIPDGAIGFVPFEMLKDDGGHYLVEHSTISYAFEYVTYQPITDQSGKQLEVFCLAPTYPVKESKEKDITRGSFYHLPFAQMEVDSIRNLFGDLAMTSQSSDKEEWEKNIGASTIFHYAGHAIIHGDHSYLAFDSQGDEKQQLTSSEIGLMHHPLDLVVLSACETGLGKIEQGEGIRSLGRSFMEAGAQATIISLWNVNDKSTALIMTDFYKQLKAGKPKDEALRQAKLNYLQRATQKNSHPYFWAAFIPAGDMSVLEK
jgi:CHAT domain-containing protein